jgi:hypothetical protein
MVHEKSKHLLAEVYRGRLDGDLGDSGAFSDVYMKRMSKEHPGKVAAPSGPFEFVAENNLDFENYKDRPEFSDELGEGSIYGGASTIGRPDTPGSAFGDSHRGRRTSRDSARTLNDDAGMTYPAGYHQTPSNLRGYSPSPAGLQRIESHPTPYEIPVQTNLLSGAAPMGRQTPGQYTPYSPDRDGQPAQHDYFRR